MADLTLHRAVRLITLLFVFRQREVFTITKESGRCAYGTAENAVTDRVF